MTTPAKLVHTTTFRLASLNMAVFLIGAALAAAFIFWQTNDLLTRRLLQTIEAEIKGLREQYALGGLTLLRNTVAQRSQQPGTSLYYLADADGRRLAGNLSREPDEMRDAVGGRVFRYGQPVADGFDQRYAVGVAINGPGDQFRLIVARDIEDQRQFASLTRSTVLWGLGFVVVVGLGGAILISRNLLRRIEGVNAASRAIMSGDLTERIPTDGSGDELDRLSENLNAMLDRIEQLMSGLREVSDNIAHDLRTPLNRLRNRIEGALHSREPADQRQVLEQTIAEADDLIRTFNALLSIARLEAGALGDGKERLDLAAVLREVVELYEPLAEESGFTMTSDVAGQVPIMGDRQLLGQAVANLIENAFKYGGTDGKGSLHVALRVEGPDAQIIVADHGPGIPEAERARVLKRFVRLDASRSEPGSGLGLSLVAAVAQMHGGSLQLGDNAPGLKVVVTVPLAGG